MEKTGIELIAIERNEQLTKHKRTVESDANYKRNQLLRVAEILIKQVPTPNQEIKLLKLFNDDFWLVEKLLKKDYKERLVIAGALIAA